MATELIDIKGLAKLARRGHSYMCQFTEYDNFPPVAFTAGTRRLYNKAAVLEFFEWLKMPIVERQSQDKQP